MRHILINWLNGWLRPQFNNNPLLFDRVHYFAKLAQALKVWLLVLIGLFALVFISCVIIIVGALNSWF